ANPAPRKNPCPTFCHDPNSVPDPQTTATTPDRMRAKPNFFVVVNSSCNSAAARSATINGITPGKSAPACDAGANRSPQLAKKTGAAPPSTIAVSPTQPRRSKANPLPITYGKTRSPATPKRSAAISHGVRLVRSPRRATTIQPDQMLTAARP